MGSTAENSAKLRAKLATLDADELEQLVRKHNALYWDEHAPEIDDPTFDKLVEALRKARPTSQVLEQLGEQKAAASPFGDVVHERPMLSLDKCYDDDALLKWATAIKGGFFMTPKIDGVACSVRYDAKGALAQAATRGDGKVGDDITANVRGIADVPKKLTGVRAALEVRGEVYLRRSRFDAVYKGDKANPRNLAAGALKTKDPKESAAYGLSFFAYDLLDGDAPGGGPKTEADKMVRLGKLGFPVLPFRHFDDKAALAEGFRAMVEECKQLDTETDGVVVKADSVAEQDRLGITAHHPRGAIAYKFQGESAQSTVRDIEWGVARSGALTPVAIIEPIFISGVTVTRVSLHNAGYAKKLGIGPGATVEVVRRGGVIPHVERVLTKPDRSLSQPKKWPVVGGFTGVHLDGDFLFLDEPERSREVVVGRVKHFADVIDAKGFGDKVLTQLFDAGMVRWPADLYRLDVNALAALERMGEKSAQNLVAVIEGKRKLTLPVLLEALGLERVGATAADKLASTFHTLPAVRTASVEQLADIDGIGPEIADAVVRGLKESRALVDALLEEVTIVAPELPSDTSHPLFGKSVVFTGALAHMDRKSAQQRVQAVGGKTPSGVSAELDYLVIGDEGSPLLGGGERSSKHKSADKLVAKGAKLAIITETDFLKMLG
ncbi:MAG: NAD-dependent DNA ligase LigA [Deltaproteobacteria bacterium]|nr:NAD-dependent DNA ligase LigA [Deltaproteobacteria bacterium]